MTSQTIGIVFDFDGTLAPDSTTGFLSSIGIDVAEFWGECNRLIAEEGYDPIPVYLQRMVDLARENQSITREKLVDYGRNIEVYNGVDTLFDRITSYVQHRSPSTSVEYYMISSGIETLLKATPVARGFHGIWGSDFVYDVKGIATGIKNVVSFTEKTRYLYNISKGFSQEDARLEPFRVNNRMESTDDFRIPFRNMVYVGDGMTDVPCFTLIKRYGGVAFGVYDENRPQKWKDAWQLIGDRRVTTIVSANFGEKSELERQMTMAIESILAGS